MPNKIRQRFLNPVSPEIVIEYPENRENFYSLMGFLKTDITVELLAISLAFRKIVELSNYYFFTFMLFFLPFSHFPKILMIRLEVTPSQVICFSNRRLRVLMCVTCMAGTCARSFTYVIKHR